MSPLIRLLPCASALIAIAALAQEPPPGPGSNKYPASPPVAGERTPAPANDARQGSMKSTGYDKKAVTAQSFATQAAVIGKAEVELGQLALERSKDPEVKRYAQRMVDDHTAAGQKLQSVASKESIPLPQSLDEEHKQLKQKLMGLTGPQFDREYTQAMSKGHDKAVALFESASQSATMPSDLKEFAASTLPTLREHREMAHDLHTKGGA